MRGCRVLWKIVLFGLGTLIFILHNIKFQSPNNENSAETRIDYSWNGPNALARSILMERQEKLQLNCDEIFNEDNNFIQLKKENLQPASFRNLLVDEKHRLLYCYVPKVACTNWKRVLMIATGKWPSDDPLEIPADQAHSKHLFPRLSNYTINDIRYRLQYYDQLIVVRHPLERLLSAYRNKFQTKNEKSARYFQSRFGRKIVKKYRQSPTQESLDRGDDVTFGEFVDFITDNADNSTALNEHWKPIYQLCHPCIVNYNFISKYETISEDATEILERINAAHIRFPSKPKREEPTVDKLNDYYSTLTYKQLQKLITLYRFDFKLFDYSLEDILGFSLA